MKADEFNALFDTHFAQPLISVGFEYIGKGHSLRLTDDTRQLLILRAGGRMAMPGMMRTTICFRHTFLRPIASDDPYSGSIYVEDCPRKLTLADFGGWRKPAPKYRPMNLGNWPRDDFPYADRNAEDVAQRLEHTLEKVRSRIVPWATSRTAREELDQIRRYGEDAWCERRWIEDYKGYIADGGV